MMSCSEEYANISGMTVDECLAEASSIDADIASVHPDDRAAYADAIQA